MEAYKRDLRERVMAAYQEQCMETAEVAEMFGVSPAWARRLKQRLRELGTIEPLPQAKRGPDPKLTDDDRARLAELVAETPDATLAELRDGLAKATGKGPVGVSTVWRAVRDLGLVLKKSPRTPPNKTAPT
jgi:transposase